MGGDEESGSGSESEAGSGLGPKLESEFGRRGLLAMLAGAAIVSVSALSGNENSLFKQTKVEFKQLAETVDQQDIADPQAIEPLQSDIENTLSAVEEQIDESEVAVPTDSESAQTTGNDAGTVSGSASSRTEMEPQTQAVIIAARYYDQLQRILTEAKRVRDELRTAEFEVFYERTELNQPPTTETSVESVERAFDELTAISARSENDASDIAALTPDRESARQELRRQITVYDRYIAAQRAFLETAALIDTGSVRQERAKNTEAKAAFESANERAAVEISATVEPYTLDSATMTLGEYQNILAQYQTAASKMANSCRDNRSDDASRQVFGEGLDALITAREIFASQYET
jgi:hypothetical protein